MKFGYEIEAHIPDNENLCKYVQRFGSSLHNKFGVDGAGIAAIEIRSKPFGSVNELLLDLVCSMCVVREYKPNYSSFIIRRVDGKWFFVTHSVHLSLDIDYDMNYYKLMWFFFVVYPLWLLRKNPLSFIRHLLRKFLYPEIMRLHPRRIELRFLSSEYPISSIEYFTNYFGLE